MGRPFQFLACNLLLAKCRRFEPLACPASSMAGSAPGRSSQGSRGRRSVSGLPCPGFLVRASWPGSAKDAPRRGVGTGLRGLPRSGTPSRRAMGDDNGVAPLSSWQQRGDPVAARAGGGAAVPLQRCCAARAVTARRGPATGPACDRAGGRGRRGPAGRAGRRDGRDGWGRRDERGWRGRQDGRGRQDERGRRDGRGRQDERGRRDERAGRTSGPAGRAGRRDERAGGTSGPAGRAGRRDGRAGRSRAGRAEPGGTGGAGGAGAGAGLRCAESGWRGS